MCATISSFSSRSMRWLAAAGDTGMCTHRSDIQRLEEVAFCPIFHGLQIVIECAHRVACYQMHSMNEIYLFFTGLSMSKYLQTNTIHEMMRHLAGLRFGPALPSRIVGLPVE